MADLKERQKYYLELLAVKFNRQDLRPIAKVWGKTGDEAKDDFIHVQTISDGMMMYTYWYIELK